LEKCRNINLRKYNFKATDKEMFQTK